jgi:GxxExxY protein
MLHVQSPLSDEQEQLITRVIDAGFAVRSILGPAFREKIYERALCLELEDRGIKFECEKSIKVKYKRWEIPGQKVDLLVGEIVLVEVKTVPRLRDIHRQQVLSYLRTMELRVGLLMNFKAATFKQGVRRVVL